MNMDERGQPAPAGFTHLGLTYWKGVCGHVWDRTVDDTDVCPRCLAETQAAGLLQQVAERDALFELQWTRSREVDKLWQAAHPGNDEVWPDLGELLGWLALGHALVRRWMDTWDMNVPPATFADLPEQTRLWLTDARPTHDLPSDTRQTFSVRDIGPQLATDILTPWHGTFASVHDDDPRDGYIRKCIDVRCGGASRVVHDTTEAVVVAHRPGCAVVEFMRRLSAPPPLRTLVGDRALVFDDNRYTVRVDKTFAANNPQIPTVERADGSLWREPTDAEHVERWTARDWQRGQAQRVLADHYPTIKAPDMPGAADRETVLSDGTE